MILELIELGGMVAAYGMGSVRGRRRNQPARSLPPICGCDHHLAEHDPQSGICHARVKVEKAWRDAEFGGKPIPTKFEYLPCTCRQYVGPKPVDSFFATDVNWSDAVMRQKSPPAAKE